MARIRINTTKNFILLCVHYELLFASFEKFVSFVLKNHSLQALLISLLDDQIVFGIIRNITNQPGSKYPAHLTESQRSVRAGRLDRRNPTRSPRNNQGGLSSQDIAIYVRGPAAPVIDHKRPRVERASTRRWKERPPEGGKSVHPKVERASTRGKSRWHHEIRAPLVLQDGGGYLFNLL